MPKNPLTSLYNQRRHYIKAHLPVGHSLVRLDVLVRLYEIYPKSSFIKELNGLIGANARTVRSAIEDLEGAGYVAEVQRRSDARFRSYRLTPRGVEKIDEYLRLVGQTVPDNGDAAGD